MVLQIQDILTSAECTAIRDILAPAELWRDGKATAGGSAARVKENQQADVSLPVVKGVLAKVEASLRANSIFLAAAQPEAFPRILLSRYGAGMRYGDHVDAAYIGSVRCDLSFTLFLSDPETYEGGELTIENAGHEDSIKLPPGSLVLYPSNAVHRVEAVQSGERLACVGWVKSRIRSNEQRALLFEVERVLAELPEGPQRIRLANIRNNLLRMFGE